jgi:hypothetical protein
MIDSLVDEIGYNADSASWNVSISNINAFTASAQSLTTASLLITASAQANSNVITFTKGNGSTFNVTVATGSIPDISNLNQATASLQAFTQSAQISINNLNTTTASLNTSVTNINTFTASTAISITNLNASSASQQVSIDSINSKTGSYATTGSNTFTAANTFTSISASSFVSASQFVGDGSKLTGITSSISMPILDEGVPQGNAVSLNFTGSAISAIVAGGVAIISVQGLDTSSFNAYTASTNSSISQLNVATASLQTNSASVNISISALNTYTASQSTASLVTSITNLNTFSASALVSITNLNSATSSYVTESETASFARTNVDNNFSANQTFTNITATSASITYLTTLYETASVIYSSGSNQLGDELTDIQTLSGSVKVQGSLTVNGTPVLTSSVDISGLVTTASFNQYTSSNNQRVSSLETNSASVNISITNINSTTASLFTSASLALITASFDTGTRNLTFTKGDTQTFSVNIPDVSGSTGNFATTGSNTFVGNQTITGSINISGSINMVNGADLVTHHVRAQGSNGLELQTSAGTNIVQMGAGGGTQAVFVGAVSANSISASTINGLGDPLVFSTSVDSRLDILEGITGSYATTGSNSFNGNQIITGSVTISGSSTTDLTVVGQIFVSSSATGGTTAPKITVSGSSGQTTILRNQVNTNNGTNSAGLNPLAIFNSVISTNDEIGFAVNAVGGGVTGWPTGSAIYVNNTALDTYPAVFGFQNKVTYTDGRVAVLTPLSASAGFTASLQDGYAWVGNSLGQNTQVATSSFGGALPSGVISGSAQITALGFVSSSVTASSLVTASVAGNILTFTKGDATTFSLTVATGSGGGGAAFPYTGSAQITGSLGVTGSVSGLPITLSVVSNTASIDMTSGNQFVLTLPSSSTTHIAAASIKAGQTINLLIKQQVGPGTGSITFAPTILFPSGLDMVATATGSAIDLISMISFDTTNLMAANVKNLK